MMEATQGGNTATMVMAVISLIGTVISGIFLLMTKILKTPQDQIAAKKLELDEKKLEDEVNSALLLRFQNLLKESDTKHSEEIRNLKQEHSTEINSFRVQLVAFEEKFIQQENRNRSLVEFVYLLIRLMRDKGLHEELSGLEGVPHGIHIY